MVTTGIDSSLYKDTKSIVKENKTMYPYVKFFVKRHLVDSVEKVKDKGVENSTRK